ncbi:MAG: glycosyltransferase [Burkholderiales bacterium]|nr:glycosyltransferase [Burkholderiales bacterium]
MRLGSKTAHLIYQAWQMGAWRVAKETRPSVSIRRLLAFDVWCFSPTQLDVEGGQAICFWPGRGWRAGTHASLEKHAIWRATAGVCEDVVNQLAWVMPGLRATYKNADLVIARTEDTRQIFPAWVQAKTKVQQEIGGYPARVAASALKGHSGTLNILFAGRLLGWKGTHLAISAFAQFLQAGGKGQFTIVGEGPVDAILKCQVAELGLGALVHFVGKLPQEELFRRYAEFDVLLFPSLHDSGGNVVIESLSFGLPVICLDLGGPSCFVDASCGVVVPAHHATESEVISALTNALQKIFGDAAWHQQLRRNALVRANDLTWEKQVQRVMSLIQTAIAEESANEKSSHISIPPAALPNQAFDQLRDACHQRRISLSWCMARPLGAKRSKG